MDYAGQRITVMGLGRFGGGVGVTKFLSARGAAVTVTDHEPAEKLQDSVRAVENLPGVSLVLGEHRAEHFRDCDLVVANPAVKPTNEYLRIAHDAGVPVTTEIVLLVRELPNRKRTIGVTGSAGKSTTTAMIAHILRKAFGQAGEAPDGSREIPGVWMGGNIGGSLLSVVDQIQNDDWVVLELSSFMLHYLREERWSPHVAVITNISPNHLDWHGDMDHYVAAKSSIMDYQVDDDWSASGVGVGDWIELPRLRHCRMSLARDWSVPKASEGTSVHLAAPGWHNYHNACIALNVVSLSQVRLADQADVLADFKGLPHRLELIADGLANGQAVSQISVRWFNDSKSTTPEAAALGMEAFESGSVHAILGGYDKGSDLSAMCEVAAQRCAGVYTIGATGDAIAERVEAAGGRAAVVRCETLENAVAAIRRSVKRGQVVLLSPGCASWDQFENYEQRGQRFVELVRGEKPTD